jgi:hypothetical protein
MVAGKKTMATKGRATVTAVTKAWQSGIESSVREMETW